MTFTATQLDQYIKVRALAKLLWIKYSDAKQLVDNGDYLVLTDEEADEECRERILESLWAFDFWFLRKYSPTIESLGEERYRNLAISAYEDLNEFVKLSIDDLDAFIEEAIGLDGRGHFIAAYDGNEESEIVNDIEYYIYRQN